MPQEYFYLAQDYFSFFPKILLAMVDNICIMIGRERKREENEKAS